jgi:D-alanine-D-alanine ligase
VSFDADLSTALTVAVLAGGRSSEHEVSLSSGAAVADGLRAAGHEVVWVEIGRDGVWRSEGEPLCVNPAGGLLDADVVFPALHGPFGEDGTVQGMLETLDVAYVGSGVSASAVCLNKVLFKELMSAAGVPQVDYVGVGAERFVRSRDAVLAEIARLGLPVFVKPAHFGSSMGIVKVSAPDALEEALEGALAQDELVIVEAMARAVEVECGVLGALRAERFAAAAPALASEPGEIVLAGDWYDFAAKYAPGGMQLRLPAGISASAGRRVRELALTAFHAAGCEGLARVDFFVDGERVLVNELNTMPGFTPTSVYAKLMAASGIPYPQLVDRLCRLGCERHAERRAGRLT